MRLSRRQLLSLTAGAGAARLLRAAPPLFEEIPPSVSGIAWVHDNAMSKEHYLPEALGPGCAFLDYDNDGWMDIYLVNSGPCDFFQPARPLRNGGRYKYGENKRATPSRSRTGKLRRSTSTRRICRAVARRRSAIRPMASANSRS